jgi:pimeloyl-ACP methyl ester carboxylesterase
VFTPTLTGVGERRHLASPAIGLDTHITDIVNTIEYEELNDVVLVAHSFSGVAATGAADRLRGRIRHIVFFDALIPHPGRMTAVETNPDGSETDKFRARRARFIDGYLMDYWADYPIQMLIADDRPDLQALVRRRLTPHPAKAWTDPLVLKNGGWEGLRPHLHPRDEQGFAPSSDKMWGRRPGRAGD